MAPEMSYPLRVVPRLSRTSRVANTAASIAIGTFISSVQRHGRVLREDPSRIRPIAAPPPAMAP